MKNDSSTGQLIVGSFCIIFALLFYQLKPDNFVILAGVIGIILVAAGICGYKDYSNRILALILGLIFLGVLIYLIYIFPFSRPEKQISIILIFILPIVIFGIPFYTSWGKISDFKKGVKLVDNGKYNEASEYFNKILKKDHNNPLAWTGKALAFRKLGKLEEAQYSINNALKLKYKTEIKIFSLSKILINSIVFNTAGLFYVEDKKYKKALKCFDKSLELKKDLYGAWNGKGVALINLGKLEESLKCFDKALRYNPKSALVLNNKGDALRRLKKYAEAMKCIDKGLKVDSKLPALWLTKGEIFMGLNKNEEALKYIDRALKLDPDFESAIKIKEELLS
ncbi:MAG: tetratricopeptide repeat protein [Methanobacterium sp.]|nr:tetratricopeptide repeat protein [Methanobacterium sp.]